MRNKTFATLGTLALLAAASAFGQERVAFNIPFEFHFGTTVMPAGHYHADRSLSRMQGVLFLGCLECRAGAAAQTQNVGDGTIRGTEGRLVFHKYGDTYILAEVWSPGSNMGSALPESKTERELSHRASLEETSQVVLVARR